MKRLSRLLRPAWAAVLFSVGVSALAQGPARRLLQPITGEARTILPNSRSPHAVPANDVGALSPDTPVNGITLVFSRTPAQQTAIDTLLAAQQNPASPQYRKWLTPESFAAQFGVNDADIAAVQTWLAAQGFTRISVPASRDSITFSGSAGQVAAALGTELHQYRPSPGEDLRPGLAANYAPATDLSLPSALAHLVVSVEHLSTFRPKANLRTSAVKPEYTSSISGSHFLTPPDLATMYDVKPLYAQGNNGTGQTIAVAGQSYIPVSDVQHFQSAAGLPANPPTLFLIPGSGGSAMYPGDEGESDLDLEYSLGMAPGANVLLVYAGANPNYGVFDSVLYAVDNNLAPIITLSYGGCELDTSSTTLQTYNTAAQKASLQGQTIITSAGDSGSTNCFGVSGLSLPQQQSLAVGVWADIPLVTAVGGLQMQAGTYDKTNSTYFANAGNVDNISSLLSYVPETVWNEDAAAATATVPTLSAGGGGASAVFARPSWQAGVPGIPAGSFRLVPDISLQASTGSPGFLYCTSDPTYWAPGQTSSCTSGFRDPATSDLTIAGGTSFSAPIFAGMLAVLNQATHATGQGNVNQTLYSLAAVSATYNSAFHDITTGSNACTVANANLCSAAGASGYTAGVGYDEASGLGSVDLAQLVAAWPATAASALTASSTKLSAATLTPIAGATDAVTVTVTAANGTPTGTVTIAVDGGTTIPITTLTLANGQASYTVPGTLAAGSHQVTATYAGDTTFAPSTGSLTLTLAGTAIPSGSFTLAVPAVTVTSGSTGSTTITLTPSGGYNGSVNFAITSGLPANTCSRITVPQAELTNGTSAPLSQYTLTIGASAAVCPLAALRGGPGGSVLAGHSLAVFASNRPASDTPSHERRNGALLAGLLAFGFLTRKRYARLPTLLAAGALTLFIGLGVSGCGGNTATVTPTTTTSAATGTYTVTLVGTDTITSNITSSTTFQLTIQ